MKKHIIHVSTVILLLLEETWVTHKVSKHAKHGNNKSYFLTIRNSLFLLFLRN